MFFIDLLLILAKFILFNSVHPHSFLIIALLLFICGLSSKKNNANSASYRENLF